MVFKDNESLTNLYEGITKQATPSKDQLTRQAPTLSRTELSKDQDMLAEAYEVMTNRGTKTCTCKYAAKGCDCNGCQDCKDNHEQLDEAKKAKKLSSAQKKIAQAAPPPDEITGSDFAALKKKKTMKEGFSFKDLYNAIMTEGEYKPDLSTKAPISGPLEHDKLVLMLRRLSNGEISSIDPESPYVATLKDGTKKPLKGESVKLMLDQITSLRVAYPEGVETDSVYDA